MATPPPSSPVFTRRGAAINHDAIPPSSPPAAASFLPSSRRRSLKRSASSSSSIDPESPSARPAKRRAIRGNTLRRSNSMSQHEAGNENTLPPSTPNGRPGLKRTPSLLPAIDFQSSPPRPTRSSQHTSMEQFPCSEANIEDDLPSLPLDRKPLKQQKSHYPTPVPTSEIGIPTSPQRPKIPTITTTTTTSSTKPSYDAATIPSRRGLGALQRTSSALSELRAPLASVPTVTLRKDPQPITFGRSANKCTYLLSKSHLVSRIHFKATFLAHGLRKQLEVHCIGFNGAKVHCKNEIYELRYGDKFWSESGADVMLEIDDARVVLKWPADSLSPSSPLSPAVGAGGVVARPVVLDPKSFPFPEGVDGHAEVKQRSVWETEGVDKFTGFTGEPVPTLKKPVSARNGLISSLALADPLPLRLSREPWSALPESPCPMPKGGKAVGGLSPMGLSNPFASGVGASITASSMAATFAVYEDEDADDVDGGVVDIIVDDEDEDSGILRESQQPESRNTEVEEYASDLDNDLEDGEVLEDDENDEDFDDENAENISQDFIVTAPSKASPLLPGEKTPTKKTYRIPQIDESVKKDPLSPKSKQSLMKHLTNQLAFSRLASTPLSQLYRSLPNTVMDKVSVGFIQGLLTTVSCIGEIKREGKDASGKLLECEYYYIADMDDDLDRKEIVNQLNKPSLRSCRKTHKQYFWKKPKV